MERVTIINIILIIILVVYIILQWYFFKKTTLSAPEISTSGNTDPKTLRGAAISINENFKGSKTGYGSQSLNNPCTFINGEIPPNLPIAEYSKICDTNLVCTGGIVEGGGICLLKNGEHCESSRDCVPGTKCINNLCQEEQEIIDKPCNSNIQCQSEGRNKFNHICYNNKCKYDIYPKDIGCQNDSECNLYGSDGNDVSCIKDLQPLPINIGGVVSNSNNEYIFNFHDSEQLQFLVPYETQFGLSNNQTGELNNNFLIKSITGTSLEIVGSSSLQEGSDTYSIVNLNYGNSNNKLLGICVSKYPLGTSPSVIPNTSTRYPCEEGSYLNSNNHCLEKNRIPNKGSKTQVCQTDIDTCDTGLCCTPDSNTQFLLGSNNNTNNRVINGTKIENIGKCFKQTQGKYFSCDNTEHCENPYICVNGRCNTIPDPYQSNTLSQCPQKYGLSGFKNCLGKKNQLCINDSDCFNGFKCSSKNSISIYDNDNDNFYPANPKFKNIPLNSKFLMSKGSSSNGTSPGTIGFYNINSPGSSIGCSVLIDGEVINLNITFENKRLALNNDTVRLSIFEKTTTSRQLNIAYIEEFPDYRLRKYEADFTSGLSIPYSYGLCQGVSLMVGVSSPQYNHYYFYKLPGTLDYTDGTSYTNSSGGYDFPSTFCGTTITEINSRFSNPSLFTYSSDYAVLGDAGDQSYKLNFSNRSETNPNDFKIQENPSFINHGDSLIYNIQGVSYGLSGSGTSPSLISGVCYFAALGPGITNNYNLFLSSEYEDLNRTLKIGTSRITGDFYYNYSDPSVAPYFSHQKKYGVKLLTYDLLNTSALPINIGVCSESYENVFTPPGGITFKNGMSSVQNNPIGYYTGLSSFKDINMEIDKENIMLTYRFSKSVVQNIGLCYHTCSIPGSSIHYDTPSIYSFNNYNGTCYNTIIYDITNNFNVPFLKTNFSGDNFPNYEIDRVQYYNKTVGSSSSIDVFANVKNMKSESTNVQVGIESKLRKIKIGDIVTTDEGICIKNILYEDIALDVDTIYNPVNIEQKYGFCNPLKMEKFKNPENYVVGLYRITLTNTDDIEKILKYSSSELAIGFFDDKEYKNIIWVITKVLNYEVGINSESLQLQINTSPTPDQDTCISDSSYTPYLFTNNILPAFFDGGGNILEGDTLRSACYSSKDVIKSFNKTYYNMLMFTNDTAPPYIARLVNVIGSDSKYPRTNNAWIDVSHTGIPLKLNNIQYKGTSYPGGYILNNLFLSSLTLDQFNFNYNNFDYPVNLKTNYISYQEDNVGDINLKTDTIPFYSGDPDNHYKLDQSYKASISYSNSLNNNPYAEPGSSLLIKKVIFNFNPGNLLNDMTYYAYVKSNDRYRLLYLNSNFSNNTNMFNTPAVLNLTNEEYVSSYSENSFMTPYDKKLYILHKDCF